jgi:hypothetical protein
MSDSYFVERDGYVERLVIDDDFARNAFIISVEREYRRLAEKIDLRVPEGWVRFRQALQGCE